MLKRISHMLIKCSSQLFVNTADFVRMNAIGCSMFDPVSVNAKNS